MVRDEQISVCSSDLHMFLSRSKQGFTPPMVVTMLYAVGARVERVRGTKFKRTKQVDVAAQTFRPPPITIPRREFRLSTD